MFFFYSRQNLGGWVPVGGNWSLCSDGPALVRFPHRRIWRLLWDRFGLDDVYSGRGLKWNFWRLVANDTELALAAPCSFGIWRGLFIILSLDLFARFEISYLKIVIRRVKLKLAFTLKEKCLQTVISHRLGFRGLFRILSLDLFAGVGNLWKQGLR